MINKSLFKSVDHDTRTPKGFFDKLNNEFDFDMDVSPHKSLIDMIKKDWFGWCYCNPPYNNQDTFLNKGLEEIKKGTCKGVVYLIPSRTDTKRFHEIILPNAKEIRFIKGRLKFAECKNSAPFPSMIVIFSS